MTGARPLQVLGLATLWLATPAWAGSLDGEGLFGDASVQISEDFEIRYHHVPEKLEFFEDRNIHDYIEQVNRLNALVVSDNLSFSAQLDEVALFSNRYRLDGELYHSWELLSPDVPSPIQDALVHLEKISLQRRWAKADLTLGDSYTSFGRGMALNIVKNTDLDIDTSIRGARAVVHAGPTDITVTTGLSNRQQISQDNRNLDIQPDNPHMISGARVEYFGLGPANVGAHGVLYRFSRSYTLLSGIERYAEPLDAVVGGATVELPGLGGIDWFAEGDLFNYRTVELAGGDAPLLGYAAYVSASAYPGPFVLLVEAKSTRDTERLNTYTTSEGWEVANVPTLEYESVITEDSSAAVNSNDLSGARARLDWGIKPGQLTSYVSVAAFRDTELGGLHFNQSAETIAHPIVGMQWLAGDRSLAINTGYRRDIRDDAADGADQLVHLDVDLHMPLWGDQGLELSSNTKQFDWGNNPQQQTDFVEMSNALSWHQGEQWTVTIFQDWTNNPLIRSTGNISDDVYGAAELQWKPTSSMVVKAFYGAYKAGIRCAGGQCRSLPGFEGGRLSLTGTF